jgi:hypothetical protein
MKSDFIKKITNEILSASTMTIESLLEHPIVKIAMSTGELLFRTNEKSVKYAAGCFATSKRNDPARGRWTFSVTCHAPWSQGSYDVRFKIKSKLPKTSGILNKQIQVSCNCNSWKFNGADFNAIHGGYSERQYSNGQAPNKKEDGKNFLICKHIAACVPMFKNFIIPKQFK